LAPAFNQTTTPVYQYTPANVSQFAQQPFTEARDPLNNVKIGINVGSLAARSSVTATEPSDAATNPIVVFYSGKSAGMNCSFRIVPLSIYSLYAGGDTGISSNQLTSDTGSIDAGRIYVRGNLNVTGAVVSSNAVTATSNITFQDTNSSIQANGQTLSSAVGVDDPNQIINQMQNGTQILTAGVQARGTQTLPASNFNDMVDPNGSLPASDQRRLGNACLYRMGQYTAPPDTGSVYVDPMANPGSMSAVSNDTTGTIQSVIIHDSAYMNSRWDNTTSAATSGVYLNTDPRLVGWQAAINPTMANRIMVTNGSGNQVVFQFIVLDFDPAHLGSLLNKTLFVQGNSSQQAVLIRNATALNSGTSIVTNLDIYVSQGVGTTSGTSAVSLITEGIVHAVN
jgi:hypothetical protein